MSTKIVKQKELVSVLDEMQEKLVKSVERLNTYIQGNGNSKKLKKKSKECLEIIKKSN
jgi:hypothetical protein